MTPIFKDIHITLHERQSLESNREGTAFFRAIISEGAPLGVQQEPLPAPLAEFPSSTETRRHTAVESPEFDVSDDKASKQAMDFLCMNVGYVLRNRWKDAMLAAREAKS